MATANVKSLAAVHLHRRVRPASQRARRRGGDASTLADCQGRRSRLSVEAAGAWRQVHKLCAGLQTPSPPPAVTYKQMLAVKTGLEVVIRTSRAWRPAPDLVPDAATADQFVTQLRQLVFTLEEISTWHLRAVRSPARVDELYAPASVLDRDELSNDRRLAVAKLAGRLVPFPQRHASRLLAAFTAVDRATWAAMKAAGAPEPLGPAVRPALRTIRAMHRSSGRSAVAL